MNAPTEEAERIGREHGKNAAGWVFDGNTDDATYRQVLRGIEDDDPMVMDAYNPPSLSGEYADEYSTEDLQGDLGIEIDWTHDDTQEQAEAFDEAANAYNEAASSGFWDEVARVAREHVKGELASVRDAMRSAAGKSGYESLKRQAKDLQALLNG